MEEEKKGIVICRVCLSTTKRKYVSLFAKRKNCFLFDQINSFTNVGIRENDGLPDKICRGCLTDLDTAINFKQKCEGSNLILQNSVVNSPEEVQIDLKDIIIKKEESTEMEIQAAHFLEDSHFFDNDDTFGDNKNLDNTLTQTDYEEKLRKSRAIDHQLQCDDCKQFFKSKCKLKVHWKRVHLTEKLLCSCKRRFKSIIAFNRHQKNKRSSCLATKDFRIEGEGKSRVFYCKECKYKSIRIKDIVTHWVIHTGDRPYKCDLCPTTCTQQSSLIAHKEAAHGDYRAEMTCQFCGKYVKGRNKMYRHLKLHTEQSVQCPVCQKSLKNKASLVQHMHRHTGVKSYTCEKCARSYYTLAELSNHRRLAHNKVKISFKCDLCEYKASRKETLKRHKSKHTSTNIACTVCGMFVENSQKLILHQRRHFEEKKHACPYCEMKFFRRDTVPKHIKSKHASIHILNHQQRSIVKDESLEKKFIKLLRYDDPDAVILGTVGNENRQKSELTTLKNDDDV